LFKNEARGRNWPVSGISAQQAQGPRSDRLSA
jgi:hypothetical protein